ncbi:hypothetical protein EBF04_09885 [Streptomyces sp. I6]|nr:hypothetical protein EBF04_09885 [Streptomyces sp. I6]
MRSATPHRNGSASPQRHAGTHGRPREPPGRARAVTANRPVTQGAFTTAGAPGAPGRPKHSHRADAPLRRPLDGSAEKWSGDR